MIDLEDYLLRPSLYFYEPKNLSQELAVFVQKEFIGILGIIRRLGRQDFEPFFI